MPFIKDTKNWNQRWDDDINYEGNGFTKYHCRKHTVLVVE